MNLHLAKYIKKEMATARHRSVTLISDQEGPEDSLSQGAADLIDGGDAHKNYQSSKRVKTSHTQSKTV
mgnify:CR=1 FL=1|jgi:hypothetical protein